MVEKYYVDEYRDRLQESIMHVIENALSVQRAIELPVDASFDQTTLSLRVRLQQNKEFLETLEEMKKERVAKIDAALTTLHVIWNQLGMPMEEGFEKMGDDLTIERLGEIEKRIEKGRKEMVCLFFLDL